MTFNNFIPSAYDDLLEPLQSGFRANRSLCTGLLKVHDIKHAMDLKFITIVFFDFSKTILSVDHNLLIHKLSSLKIIQIGL